MPAAYSPEFRRRVVDAHENGEGSFKELAERFKIGEATVNRWVALKRRTGSLDPLPRPGRAKDRLVTEEGERFVERVLDEVPDSSVPELVTAYEEEFGIRMSESTMKRTLKRLGFTRKRGSSARQVRSAPMWWQRGRSSRRSRRTSTLRDSSSLMSARSAPR